MEYKWKWWEILLWGYSIFWVFLVIVTATLQALDLYKVEVSTDTAASVISAISFLPIFAFLIMEGIKHLKS